MQMGMGGNAMSLSGLAQGGDFQQGPSIQNPAGVSGTPEALFAEYDKCVMCLKYLGDVETDPARGAKVQMMAAQLNQMKVDRQREVQQLQQQVARAGSGVM